MCVRLFDAIDAELCSRFEWKNAFGDELGVHGLVMENGAPQRLPQTIRCAVNDGVTTLALDTSGGRIRFETDSERIAFHVCLRGARPMPHMPLSGSSGLDVYSGDSFFGAVRPENNSGTRYEGVVETPGGMRGYTVNLPLYNGVTAVYIGFLPGSKVTAPKPYTYPTPFVLYGSSITQGGCATRPGNMYPAYLSRWLDSDFINLGFSGSARGEEVMARHIAGLKISAFIYDYDHNAPNPEHLEKTHEAFFRIIRREQPELPVVFVSKPDFDYNLPDSRRRRDIIMRTYQNALDAGDKKVWFVDGETLFGKEDRGACTVDRVHPNDLGFYRMAKGIYPTLKEILG